MFQKVLGPQASSYLLPIFHEVFHVQDVSGNGIGLITRLHVDRSWVPAELAKKAQRRDTDNAPETEASLQIKKYLGRIRGLRAAFETLTSHSLVALSWVHVSESWKTLLHLTQWTSTMTSRARLRA